MIVDDCPTDGYHFVTGSGEAEATDIEEGDWVKSNGLSYPNGGGCCNDNAGGWPLDSGNSMSLEWAISMRRYPINRLEIVRL